MGDSTLLICLGIIVGIIVVLVLLAIVRKGSGGSSRPGPTRREPASKDGAKRAKTSRPIDASRSKDKEKRTAVPERTKSRGRPEARDADERTAARRDKSDVSKTAAHVKKPDPAKEPFQDRDARRKAFEDRARDAREKGVVSERSKSSEKPRKSDDPKKADKSRTDGPPRKPPK